ncbi:hypothetical protein ACFXO9_27010 [Nocardia tengchongensis]|uniref:thiolase family protein n=1 Tax=Nocardia tengchongensis TaxID=2055889 RepID=UPI0036AAF536
MCVPLVAGLPQTVAAVQINMFCRGLEATDLAAQKLRLCFESLVIAGGLESMSRLSIGSGGGAPFNDPTTSYDLPFVPQETGADLSTKVERFSRDDVEEYAVRSQRCAELDWPGGYFTKSVVPVRDRNRVMVRDPDEHPRPGTTVRWGLRLPKQLVRLPGLMRWRDRHKAGAEPWKPEELPSQWIRGAMPEPGQRIGHT